MAVLYINTGMVVMQKQHIRGVTYLEILVVLMILIALTSLVSFKFSKAYYAEEVRQASEIFLSDCLYARSVALAEKQSIILTKDGEHSYKIINQRGKLIKSTIFSNDITLLAKDSESIIFFSNGTTLGNTFLLKKFTSKRYVVVSILGRVRISDNEVF